MLFSFPLLEGKKAFTNGDNILGNTILQQWPIAKGKKIGRWFHCHIILL